VSAYDQGDHCGGGLCGAGTCVWSQHSGNTCTEGKCCTNPFGFGGVHSRFKQEIGRRMALVVEHVANLSSTSTPSSKFDLRGETAAAPWAGPRPVSAVFDATDGTYVVSFTTADGGNDGGSMYMHATRDCWECCDPARAKDVFQLSATFAKPDGNDRSEVWVNSTFSFDRGSGKVTLRPEVTKDPQGSPAGESHTRQNSPFVVIRYAASLWPQCAIYSASNNVPAYSFSSLNVTTRS
jgi:hypothetical protein